MKSPATTLAATATCLYCEETKACTAFNREHVIPQSFGTFPESPVLRDCVCEQCNSYFSRELELKLGRNSAEGLERFKAGTASRKTRRSIGHEIDLRYDGGPFDGAIHEWCVAPDGKTLLASAVPQIGFSTSKSGPFKWYRVADLPDLPTLCALGFKSEGTYIRTGGLSEEDARRYLHELGYGDPAFVEESPEIAEDGTIPLKISGTIDHAQMRAVAKIAFNYMAFHYPAIASMEQFASIRRYIRFGELPSAYPVTVSTDFVLGGVPEEHQLLAHVLTVAWRRTEKKVVAHVSLFCWVQYNIILTTEPFAVPPLCVDSGHIFDPVNRQILRLSRWIPPDLATPIPMRRRSES